MQEHAASRIMNRIRTAAAGTQVGEEKEETSRLARLAALQGQALPSA